MEKAPPQTLPDDSRACPSTPSISPLVALWKGVAKPLAVLAMIGAVVGGFFHYMKVGPIEVEGGREEDKA